MRASTPVRRGSTFSDRQIFAAVKDGRAIEFVLPATTERKVIGWVYGVDDYHWGVVDQRGSTFLVHKSAPLLQILPARLDQLSEHVRDCVEPLVAPFRAYVMREHFKHDPASDN